MPELIPRRSCGEVLTALRESRVAAVVGPRQAGKTTLVRDLISERYRASYVTLDDIETRSAAESDPTGFVQDSSRMIIDEIQRVPELLLAIKVRVDRDTRPGQFLITGSANIQTLRTIPDALPGRVEYVRLWPLAQSEIEEYGGNLVDDVFAGRVRTEGTGEGRRRVAERIARGGFPGAIKRTARSRVRFFDDYIASVVGRDVPEIIRAREPANLGRLLRVLAVRSASLLSRQALAGDIGVDDKTIASHLRVLEDLMLVRLHPAWHTNLSKREVKTPKVYLMDTGLLTSLIGASVDRIATAAAIGGMSFETFAVAELVKLADWAAVPTRIFHYRDREGREVDVVLERPDGEIVGVEVKASIAVRSSDFRGLAYLRDQTGSRFRLGVVLHPGERSLSFGDRLVSGPISALWS